MRTGLKGLCTSFLKQTTILAAVCVSAFAQAPAPDPLQFTTITANTIGLSWNDIYSDEDGFRVERFDQMTGMYVHIAVLGPNVTTFLDTGLNAGQMYSYLVVAFNSGGDSVPAYNFAYASPVPGPDPLQITTITANTIGLSWNDIYSDEDG